MAASAHMKRFIFSLTLCTLFLTSAALILSNAATAKDDVINQLLSLPAPPPNGPHSKKRTRRVRPSDRQAPPADDAPIDELLEYWQARSSGYRDLGYNPIASPRVQDRLRAEIEKEPKLAGSLMNVFRDSPNGIDLIKGVYDNWQDASQEGKESRASLKRWLTMNSSFFSEQLSKSASMAGEQGEYVRNQDQLLALTKHDWEAARPSVDKLYSNTAEPTARVLGIWALYKHAIAENSNGDIDRFRRELMDVVEDKNATAGMRDLAFDALVKETDWSGRDEWYYTLLEDESLAELRINGQLYTGLTTLIMYSHPDKYADKMIELAGSRNRVVRNAAARNLGVILDGERADVIAALLPWLEDPKWAKDHGGTRGQLVRVLRAVKVPGSVTGLLAALNEKEVYEVPAGSGNSNALYNAANTIANAMNSVGPYSNANRAGSNATGKTVTVTRFPLRSDAIAALAKQEDIRAVPDLRRVLSEVQGYERSQVVNALLECGGYSVIEQADGVETFARTIKEKQHDRGGYSANTAANIVSDEDSSSIDMSNFFSVMSDDNIKNILGMALLQKQEPGDALVREIVARIGRLEKNEPEIAEMLRGMLLNWKTPAVYALHLKDLKDGRSDLDAIVKLLAARKLLRQKLPGDIYDIRTGGPLPAGLSACLMESDSEYAAILAGTNAETKAAMLACARLVRAKLPVQQVAKNLGAADKRLVSAAELYLESEDSPEARAIVLSVNPNEAKILGATTAFWPEGKHRESAFTAELFDSMFEQEAEAVPAVLPAHLIDYSPAGSIGTGGIFYDVEKRLKDEIKSDAGPAAVYSYDGNHVRIYKDRVVFSWDEDDSRYRERALSKEEFEDLTDFLARQNVDNLPPFLDCVDGDCPQRQLLMLGKAGGRRVFMYGRRRPELFAGLDSIFESFRAVSGARLRYQLEKEIPGLEILVADDTKKIETVWKNGSDFRVLAADAAKAERIEKEITGEGAESEDGAELIEDEYDYEAESRVWELRRKRRYEHFGWFTISDRRLAGSVSQPDGVEFLPKVDGLKPDAISGQWKARAGNVEIRADEEGLYKVTGGKPVRIVAGGYTNIVVTPNGRWAIAAKYSDSGPGLYRINLATNREYKVEQKEYFLLRPIAFVHSVNRILIGSGYGGHHYEEDGENSSGSYMWLDPETGAMQPAAGEVRPLSEQSFRPLQPGPGPFEYWAAIYDQVSGKTNVGIYNSRTFSLKTLLTVPKIAFNSMQMWSDPAAGKVYFVYKGHLLSLPIPPARSGP